MKKALILVRGVPGSGKSTVAKMFASVNTPKLEGHMSSLDNEHTICTADDFFMKDGEYKYNPKMIGAAHNWCQWKCKKAMMMEESKIFVANTTTTEKEMKPYYDLAEEFGYNVISLVVENRHGGKNEHGVPDEVLEKMEARFSIKLR